MIGSVLIHRASVQRAVETTTTDDYGFPVTETTPTVVEASLPCYVKPVDKKKFVTSERISLKQRFRGYAPLGANLKFQDRIQVRSLGGKVHYEGLRVTALVAWSDGRGHVSFECEKAA